MPNVLLDVLLLPAAFIIGTWGGIAARRAWLGIAVDQRTEWLKVWAAWCAIYSAAAILMSFGGLGK